MTKNVPHVAAYNTIHVGWRVLMSCTISVARHNSACSYCLVYVVFFSDAYMSVNPNRQTISDFSTVVGRATNMQMYAGSNSTSVNHHEFIFMTYIVRVITPTR